MIRFGDRVCFISPRKNTGALLMNFVKITAKARLASAKCNCAQSACVGGVFPKSAAGRAKAVIVSCFLLFLSPIDGGTIIDLIFAALFWWYRHLLVWRLFKITVQQDRACGLWFSYPSRFLIYSHHSRAKQDPSMDRENITEILAPKRESKGKEDAHPIYQT